MRRWNTTGKSLARTAGAALRLAWSAAPAGMIAQALLALATAVLPVLVAWLTKLLVDALSGAARGPLDQLLWLAGGLVVCGLSIAILPRAGTFVGMENGRAIALRTHERLYRAVDGFAGLARFEDPVFLDRLRLGQQSAAQAPKAVGDAGIALCGAIVTAVGFLGSLVLVSPVLAVVVLASAVPALLAQLRLSRRRAGMMWTIGPAERREFFFGSLLADVQAAKEIRLFGAGRFLRERMLAERATADAAKRRQDLGDLLTLGGLAVLSAAVAGGGLVWAITEAHRGVVSAGDVTMLVAAVAGVQAALTQLTTALAGTYHQLLMFDHYLAVVRAGPDLSTPAAPLPVPPLRHGIELRGVWFRYFEEHSWVLRGVDLFLPAGGPRRWSGATARASPRW